LGGIVHVIPKSTHFLWNICIWSIKYYGVSYPYVGNFSITLYFTQSHYIYIHIIVYGVSNTIHQLPFSWHIQVGRECWEERFVSSKMSLPLSPQGQLSQGPTEPAWISQPWFGSEKACFSPCVYQRIWWFQMISVGLVGGWSTNISNMSFDQEEQGLQIDSCRFNQWTVKVGIQFAQN
jgi:hypothetical protein